MSMFDRNVKIQINKMKYADLISKDPKIPFNHKINPLKVYQARMFMLLLGVGCGASLMHYDIFWYKTTRGLARWKNRLLSWFPAQHGHHGHGNSHSDHHASSHTSSHSTDHHNDSKISSKDAHSNEHNAHKSHH